MNSLHYSYRKIGSFYCILNPEGKIVKTRIRSRLDALRQVQMHQRQLDKEAQDMLGNGILPPEAETSNSDSVEQPQHEEESSVIQDHPLFPTAIVTDVDGEVSEEEEQSEEEEEERDKRKQHAERLLATRRNKAVSSPKRNSSNSATNKRRS